MGKVKLQLGDLQVESFAVEADAAEAGTVHGQQVHAESGEYWTCGTMCCLSYYPTNCPGDDPCAQTQYLSCRHTECSDVYTCSPTCETCDPAWCPAAG
jgi:hypothetical protein